MRRTARVARGRVWRDLVLGRRARQALAGVAALALLTAYAVLIEPNRVRPTRFALWTPGLPPTLDGVRIAHLTDFHVGTRGAPMTALRRGVALAAAWHPDLVVLTGDFVDDGRWRPEAALFTALVAIAPVYAVLGNHDHWGSPGDVDDIVAGLHANGVTTLANTHAIVQLPARGDVTLVGVDDPSLEQDDLGAALRGLPAPADPDRPTLLLAHAPEIAERAPADRFAAILCGHTHGGQVRLSPFHHRTPLEISMIVGGIASPYPRGIHHVRGNPLLVNRGLGVSGLPLRFLAPPEVALITLRRAPASAASRLERLD